jgi:hypothetical protein
MRRVMGLLIVLLLAVAQDIRAIEKQMADRPAEAFAIARRAADALPPERFRDLLATAARLQEERLAQLTEGQVEDLAGVHAGPLGDARAAERVRRDWLRERRQALGPADGPGRLRLARLTHRWLRDRDAAARLCLDALRVAPELDAAAQMLRDDLDYQSTETGWKPREAVEPIDRARNAARVRIGMTPAEVRALLGAPDRVARQILYHRYLEQWVYNDQAPLWVEFNCLRGKEPYVLTVQAPAPPNP